MGKLLTGNVIFGLLLLAATGLYMAGVGPVTFVEKDQPKVGKFVSVTPKTPEGETRPAGLFELAIERQIVAPERERRAEEAALPALERLQLRRDPEQGNTVVSTLLNEEVDALGRPLSRQAPKRPSLSALYRASVGATDAPQTSIDRLEAARP